MKPPLGGFTVEDFLAHYWQRQPCLVRQAFPAFQPQLDGNDVAGLACDEMAESRLVSGSHERQDWAVRHGPFQAEELQHLPDTGWTLLVQDVEKHYPPLQALLAQFNFLPSWRLDDLMVSVSAPGGSVGPHVDQYDVFLLQASGQRRWQVASEFDPTLLPECELNVLANFTAEQEWILEAGDMLYLPPGVAHHGVALDEGMTWSVGLRAPSQADLFLGLGEWLAEAADEGQRYQDGSFRQTPRPGEISRNALRDLHKLMAASLAQKTDLDRFLGTFLSRYRLAQPPARPPSLIDEAMLKAALSGRAALQLNPWTRLAWIEHGSRARLFAAGQEYPCSIATAVALCSYPIAIDGPHPVDATALRLVCALINDGHLCLSR